MFHFSNHLEPTSCSIFQTIIMQHILNDTIQKRPVRGKKEGRRVGTFNRLTSYESYRIVTRYKISTMVITGYENPEYYILIS